MDAEQWKRWAAWTRITGLHGPMIGTPDDAGWLAVMLPELPWRISVLVEELHGVPQMVGLRLEPVPVGSAETEEQRRLAHPELLDEAVISAEKLRRLPLRMLKEVGCEARATSRRPPASDPGAAQPDLPPEFLSRIQASLSATDVLTQMRETEREAGQPWPNEHYVRVAAIYRDAVSRALPPLKAIKDHWHVSRAMASKYVKRARELGLLGYPARPGVAGADATESPIPPRKQRPPTPTSKPGSRT